MRKNTDTKIQLQNTNKQIRAKSFYFYLKPSAITTMALSNAAINSKCY